MRWSCPIYHLELDYPFDPEYNINMQLKWSLNFESEW